MVFVFAIERQISEAFAKLREAHQLIKALSSDIPIRFSTEKSANKRPPAIIFFSVDFAANLTNEFSMIAECDSKGNVKRSIQFSEGTFAAHLCEANKVIFN